MADDDLEAELTCRGRCSFDGAWVADQDAGEGVWPHDAAAAGAVVGVAGADVEVATEEIGGDLMPAEDLWAYGDRDGDGDSEEVLA